MRWTFVISAELPDGLTEEQVRELQTAMEVQLEDGRVSGPGGEELEVFAGDLRGQAFDAEEWNALHSAACVGMDDAGAACAHERRSAEARLFDRVWERFYSLGPVPPPREGGE